MDCRRALEILESARPDSEDYLDAEFAGAVLHLEDCPGCIAALRERNARDERIGSMIRCVPVPAGLEQRLLNAVQSAAEAAASTGSRPEMVSPAAPPPQQKFSRRVWIRAAALTAAASLLVGTAAWLIVEQQLGGVTVAELSDTAPLALEGLPAFDKSFTARLPERWTISRRLTIGPARGMSLSGERRHGAALYPFTVESAGSALTSGVLLVVPRRAIKSAPEPTHFQAANVNYFSRSAAVSWQSDGLVYVCFVKNGEAAEMVGRALEMHPA